MKASAEKQEQVLRLAELDQQIGATESKISDLRDGKVIAELRQVLIRSSEQLLQARTDLDNIETELRRSENDLELVEKRITQDNERLKSSSSHKDAEGIQHELLSLKARLSNLEDVELEILERKDNATSDLEKLTVARNEAQLAVQQAEEQADAELIKLQSGLALLKAEHAKLLSGLDEELAALYVRKASRGIAAARLIGRDCNACRIALTSAAYEDVIATPRDEIATCTNCQAVLIR